MSPQLLQSVRPRPFLKWAGGKGQLISQYIPHFPRQFSIYHEPFLGGGAIFFHLQPQQARLMDINPELVNVFCCVRDRVEELITLLQHHRDRHSSDYYYALRSQAVGSDLERAARLIYLNKTCFNGLYRENSKGQFNVPLGKYKKPAICDPESLRSASLLLRSTQIARKPFEAVLEFAQTSADFVYFDPPYYPISSTSRFTSYSRDSFCEADQIRLRDAVVTLTQRGVQVMLSNSDCPFVRELYQDFSIHTILATRSINSNGERRGKIAEVLITNYSN